MARDENSIRRYYSVHFFLCVYILCWNRTNLIEIPNMKIYFWKLISVMPLNGSYTNARLHTPDGIDLSKPPILSYTLSIQFNHTFFHIHLQINSTLSLNRSLSTSLYLSLSCLCTLPFGIIEFHLLWRNEWNISILYCELVMRRWNSLLFNLSLSYLIAFVPSAHPWTLIARIDFSSFMCLAVMGKLRHIIIVKPPFVPIELIRSLCIVNLFLQRNAKRCDKYTIVYVYMCSYTFRMSWICTLYPCVFRSLQPSWIDRNNRPNQKLLRQKKRWNE